MLHVPEDIQPIECVESPHSIAYKRKELRLCDMPKGKVTTTNLRSPSKFQLICHFDFPFINRTFILHRVSPIHRISISICVSMIPI